MPLIIEQYRVGYWLKGEVQSPQLYSRDQITLQGATGAPQIILSGTVLGKITATNLWVPLAPAAADGSQNAAGILYLDVTVPVGINTQAVAITRDATVMDIGLIFPAGATAPQVSTAIGQLLAAPAGIVTRRGA